MYLQYIPLFTGDTSRTSRGSPRTSASRRTTSKRSARISGHSSPSHYCTLHSILLGSSFKYELLDILKKNAMVVPDNKKGDGILGRKSKNMERQIQKGFQISKIEVKLISYSKIWGFHLSFPCCLDLITDM